jgi:DNA-binding beta-propeller fold protein YncE
MAALNAQLDLPWSIALDGAGNLYIGELGNKRVRKVSGGTITTIAGGGDFGSQGDNIPAVGALVYPLGIAVDSAGTNLYLTDSVPESGK